MELYVGGRGEEKDVKEGAKPIDPLLQLITLFSRSALTESRCVCAYHKRITCNNISSQHNYY